MPELEVTVEVDGREYWGLYSYGSEFTDAPEEREYPVVSLLEFGAWNQAGDSVYVLQELPKGVLEPLDEAALQAASLKLNLP